LNALGTPAKDDYADWQFRALGTLLDSLDQRNSSLAELAKGSEEQRAAVKRLAGLFAAARKAATDREAQEGRRMVAIALMGREPDHRDADLKRLAGLLTPQTPEQLRSAAVGTLGQLREVSVPALLLRGWGGYGPKLRSQVLDVLF